MRKHNSRNTILPEVVVGCQTHRVLPHPVFSALRRKRQGIVAGLCPRAKGFQPLRTTNLPRFPDLNDTGTRSFIVSNPGLASITTGIRFTTIATVP